MTKVAASGERVTGPFVKLIGFHLNQCHSYYDKCPKILEYFIPYFLA